MQALEVQVKASLAEHEAKLGQQQEALAHQSQKGLAILQARITALQTTLTSDSAQHAAAYTDLQRQHEATTREKEAACSKGMIACRRSSCIIAWHLILHSILLLMLTCSNGLKLHKERGNSLQQRCDRMQTLQKQSLVMHHCPTD